MKQTDPGLDLTTKQAREREFLGPMERGAPRTALVDLVAPAAPTGMKSRLPGAMHTMLGVRLMQQRFTLSHPAIEGPLNGLALFSELANLGLGKGLPAESTALLPGDKGLLLKAGVRANLDHPLQVIKRRFGLMTARCRALQKNTTPLTTLFALSHLRMARNVLGVLHEDFRLKTAVAT